MDSAFLILKGGIPGSLGFLLLGLTVGVILLLVRPTCRRWGHAWLIALIAFYWALFLPAFALWLQAGLVGDLGQVSRRDVRDVDTIVALSAGGYTVREGARALHVLTYHSALTVLETARVFHLLDDATILVSGGISAPDRLGPESASMRDGLVVVDIPMTRIRVESKSRNTFEQAVEVSRLLRADRRDRFVLVTRPAHMWRSMILFEAQGMHPIPSTTRLRPEGTPRLARWVPSSEALYLSQEALYEYAALIYAWGRGWLQDMSGPQHVESMPGSPAPASSWIPRGGDAGQSALCSGR